VFHAFNIHRLVGIYSSIEGIISNSTSLIYKPNSILEHDLSIELISDINTLIDLNLMKYVKFNDSANQSKKLAVTIGIDFAEKIAQDFSIKLDDFIKIEV
jgi:hypothetical protein